jgi:hypothetical protein
MTVTRALAIRFCSMLGVFVEWKPREWRDATAIAARAGITSARKGNNAICYAMERGWLEGDEHGRVCLTEVKIPSH